MNRRDLQRAAVYAFGWLIGALAVFGLFALGLWLVRIVGGA